MVYERCPRCEINYKQDWESVCEICKKEMEGFWIEEDDEEFEKLCPYCEINIIESGEMCASCLKRFSKKDGDGYIS